MERQQYRVGPLGHELQPYRMGPPIKETLHLYYYKDKNGCWLWRFGQSGGYGWVSGHGRAHRYVFKLFFGEIPKGLGVCHTCDNRPCINPKHLFLGTQQDNMRDASDKGRIRGRSPQLIKSRYKMRKLKRENPNAEQGTVD